MTLPPPASNFLTSQTQGRRCSHSPSDPPLSSRCVTNEDEDYAIMLFTTKSSYQHSLISLPHGLEATDDALHYQVLYLGPQPLISTL
jgi:hypothetical protein